MSGFYSAYQVAPVTQQAIVTANAAFDRHLCNVRKSESADNVEKEYASSDDHVYTIAQRELCFRLNHRYDDVISRPGTNGINDIELKVHSSVNNWLTADRWKQGLRAITSAEKMQVFRDTVSFAGVAQQPIDYMNKNSKDTVALQFGGSCSVWNTGHLAIRPGQLIIWDFPLGAQNGAGKRKQPPGEPQEKFLYATLPLEAAYNDDKQMGMMNYDFVSSLYTVHKHIYADPNAKAKTDEGEQLRNIFRKMENELDVAGADRNAKAQIFEKNLKQYSKTVVHMYESVRSRIIGKALSGAKPGQSFDILLGAFH